MGPKSNGPQMGPKGPQMGPKQKWAQMGPKWDPNGPQRAPNNRGPKWDPNGPQIMNPQQVPGPHSPLIPHFPRPLFLAGSNFLAIPQIFWMSYSAERDRVSMVFFIFSPNGKNFCQSMAPDFPKPMFLAQIQPGLLGALAFYFSKN